MINLTQVILVVVITTLTILLTVIGIQVVSILKDLKETLKRINKIADNAEVITSAVVRPVTGVSRLVEGVQSSLKIAELLGYIKKNAKTAAEQLPEKIADIKEDIGQLKEDFNSQIDDPAKDGSPGNGHLKSAPGPKPDSSTGQSSIRRFFHRSGTPLG